MVRWCDDIPVNFCATIMAMESCGENWLTSEAGAVGLFQIIPRFHKQPGDDLWNPDTNALRATEHINLCAWRENENNLVYDSLTFACYNGGHYVFDAQTEAWASETKRYFELATLLYAAVETNNAEWYADWWEEKKYVCERAERNLLG